MTSQREPIAATPPLVEEQLTASPRTASSSPAVSGAKCTQCGSVIRHMPMFLKNVTCRNCYGAERYKRGETSMIGGARKVPEPSEPLRPSESSRAVEPLLPVEPFKISP